MHFTCSSWLTTTDIMVKSQSYKSSWRNTRASTIQSKKKALWRSSNNQQEEATNQDIYLKFLANWAIFDKQLKVILIWTILKQWSNNIAPLLTFQNTKKLNAHILFSSKINLKTCMVKSSLKGTSLLDCQIRMGRIMSRMLKISFSHRLIIFNKNAYPQQHNRKVNLIEL